MGVWFQLVSSSYYRLSRQLPLSSSDLLAGLWRRWTRQRDRDSFWSESWFVPFHSSSARLSDRRDQDVWTYLRSLISSDRTERHFFFQLNYTLPGCLKWERERVSVSFETKRERDRDKKSLLEPTRSKRASGVDEGPRGRLFSFVVSLLPEMSSRRRSGVNSFI